MQKLQNGFEWDRLKETKNLLAFSAGVDSTALFFMLLEKEINFDVAIVNYNTRKTSKDETEYAIELARQYNKKIFTKSVNLENANFEANARSARYKFFEQTIKKENYETLLTAHHLGDRLEWFFMQFVRGAGAVEICGFDKWEKRKNYFIARPLFEHTKDELLAFLKENNRKYFIDETNFDSKFERARFRKDYSSPLLKEFKDGILRSFRALEKDKTNLMPSEYKQIRDLYFFERDKNEIRLIAKIAKFFKIVLSAKQREVAEKSDECVIGDKIAIGKNAKFVFIAPYLKDVAMDKKFKELCRKAKIPKNIRAYLFKYEVSAENIH